MGVGDARYLRQVLLAEIGAAGQARIGEATARVAGVGLAHEVATLYARAAGFPRVESSSAAIDELALAPLVFAKHAAPRAVLAGARAALREILRAAEGACSV